MSEKKPVRSHPELVLKKLWASLATGNIGSSVYAASTIGSLTCKYLYGWERCNRSIRGKVTEEEKGRKMHRREKAIRIEEG